MVFVPEGSSRGAPGGAWRALAEAATAEQLCVAWLAVLCRSVVDARAGMVLLARPDGSFAPAAAEPATQDLRYLADVATEALRAREGVVRQDAPGRALLAYPLALQDRLAGAIVVDVVAGNDVALDRALRMMHWGAGWLVDMLHQRALGEQQAQVRQGRFLLDTLLALVEERSEREAALALVNRLGRELDCHQVQLGVARGKTVRVLAMSNSAWFDERSGIVNLAAQAMHEAFDQRGRIDWPAPKAEGAGLEAEGGDPKAGEGGPKAADTAATEAVAPTLVSAAHRRYAEQAGSAALCTLPLVGPTRIAGVLMLERDRPFDAGERAYLDTLALALAPAFELQREAGQGAAMRLLRTGRRWLGRVTDSSHPAIKLGAGVALLVVLMLALVPAPFRIPAQALVEGSVQRAVVAPFEGFVREAPARAGDTVKTGQVLARLEDKDLRLERVRWESELEVAQRKELEAMAKGSRVEQRLAAAQANQARAQLDLTLARLERAVVSAPFDGIVVKGDLSQQIGSPVEVGKVLFEVAPLDSWRVVLKVDERDIGFVQIGAAGNLVLSSLPGAAWPFKVRKLTPVAVAEEGRNHFRVEAELGAHAPRLSPNMEGVGKIDAGRRSLLWTWTRPLVAWMRLTWWKLMP